MPHGVSEEVVFKPYLQDQLLLLPPSLEELIPPGHLVRVVDMAVERMKLDALLEAYDVGGGASRYHPKMLLKVLVYGYTQQLYSSRRLAKALRENVHFMWLSAGQRPDFRTLNRFRSSKLKCKINEVFAALVELLVEAGLIRLQDYFLDGTKIEANANRYSFVWGKATRRHKERLQVQVKALLQQIESVNDQENVRYGENDLEELGEDRPIDAEQLAAKLQELEGRLSGDLPSKSSNDGDDDQGPSPRQRLKKAATKIRKDLLPRLQKYEKHEEILGDRNSFSKTDEDATFMRMKEDHMRNGQLKPGYNVQIGTERQFITGFSLHQDRGDSPTLPSHLDDFKRLHGRYPARVIADAGYGSEENYRYLGDREITGYVKYGSFDQEQSQRRRAKFGLNTFGYEAETDSYRCPDGRELAYQRSRRGRSDNGYVSETRIYAGDCNGCTLKGRCCHKSAHRQLHVNRALEEYRGEALRLLTSPEGLTYRSRRLVEPESVFGQLKWNRGIRRFLLRGMEKVKAEFGLMALAHNTMKLATTFQLIPT
jgi:transposase